MHATICITVEVQISSPSVGRLRSLTVTQMLSRRVPIEPAAGSMRLPMWPTAWDRAGHLQLVGVKPFRMM